MLGLAVGIAFAAGVSRLTPVQPFPTKPAGRMLVPALSGRPVYTATAVSVSASPGGPSVGTLDAATPVRTADEQAGQLQVEANLFRTAESPAVLYQDPARLIRGGRLSAPDAAVESGTVSVGGTSWQAVRLVGWIPSGSTSEDLGDLWLRASITYARACGHCHSVHAPSEFTASAWVGRFRSMVPRTTLTESQADFVLKWLQTHARP
jgi:hypothetical protein